MLKSLSKLGEIYRDSIAVFIGWFVVSAIAECSGDARPYKLWIKYTPLIIVIWVLVLPAYVYWWIKGGKNNA